MAGPAPEQDAIERALLKYRAWDQGEAVVLAGDEIAVLASFSEARLSQPELPERDRALCLQIRLNLDKLGQGVEPEQVRVERRTNALLRNAIEKYLQGRHAEVTPADVRLMRLTHQRLAELPERSASQSRLEEILKGALAQYPDFAATLEDTPALAIASSACREVDAASLFTGAARTRVQEISGIAVSLTVEAYEIDGGLAVAGDIPEGVLLRVSNGELRVSGCVFGNVHASGGVRVGKNIQGGWVVSERGDIQAGRILPGARVIALRGAVHAGALESPERIVSACAIEVRESARGGLYYSDVFSCGGTVRGGRLHVLTEARAAAFEPLGRETMSICMPPLVTSEAFGRPLPDAAVNALRTIVRLRCRVAFAARAGTLATAAVMEAQRDILYLLQADEARRAEFPGGRNAQCLRHAFTGAILAAEALLDGVAAAQSARGGDALRYGVLAATAVDECLAHLKTLERDAAHMPDDIARTAKARFAKVLLQISSIARKVKDAAAAEDTGESALAELDARLAEWRAEGAAAEEQAAASFPTFEAAIGAEAAAECDLDKLGRLVSRAITNPGAKPDIAKVAASPLVRQLRAAAEHHRGAAGQALELAETAASEWNRIAADLRESGDVWMAPAGTVRSMRADKWSPGILLLTAPDQAPSGSQFPARNCRIDFPPQGPITCDAGCLRIG